MPETLVIMAPDIKVRREYGLKDKVKDEADDHKAVLVQNALFAQQFKEGAPAKRAVVSVKVNGKIATDFVKAFEKAASLAGKGGTIIQFTGHGSRDPAETPGAVFGIETVPELKPGLQKTEKITVEELEFDKIAHKVGNKWVPTQVTGNVANTSVSQGTVDRIAKKYAVLEKMAQAIQRNGIDSYILLTCNCAVHAIQCQQLANLLNVKVYAYEALIATSVLDAIEIPGKKKLNNCIIWTTKNRHAKQPNVLDDLLRIALSGPKSEQEQKRFDLEWRKSYFWSFYPITDIKLFYPK